MRSKLRLEYGIGKILSGLIWLSAHTKISHILILYQNNVRVLHFFILAHTTLCIECNCQIFVLNILLSMCCHTYIAIAVQAIAKRQIETP